MTKTTVIITDIFGEIVEEINRVLAPMVVKYFFGRQLQVLKQLQDLNNSQTLINDKYPLLALFQDFPERRGLGYYGNIQIPKIIIATLTEDFTYPKNRYDVTFKPILYPIYDEFMHQLVRHPNVNESDQDYIPHVKWDRPGSGAIGLDLNDVVDAIEINNLTFTVSQFKICKNGTQKSL